MTSQKYPVLLIHGIDDTVHVFSSMVTYLSDRVGVPIHTLNLIPNNGDVGLDKLALQIQAYVEQHMKSVERFDLVGFSMGGIVSRFYIQRLLGWQRVRRFITLSAPHNGTWTGHLRRNAGAAQMRPDSPFLKDLNDSVGDLNQVEFISVWTPYDLMIVPASSSALPVGKEIQLPVLAHPWMLTDRRSLSAIAEALLAE